MEYLRINHSIMFLPLLHAFKWKNLCYMNSILQDRLDAIKELYKRYKVRSLYSFGSVNTPRFTEHSDIDLLIEFDPSISLEEYADNCFSLRARLVKLFKDRLGDQSFLIQSLFHRRYRTRQAITLWGIVVFRNISVISSNPFYPLRNIWVRKGIL